MHKESSPASALDKVLECLEDNGISANESQYVLREFYYALAGIPCPDDMDAKLDSRVQNAFSHSEVQLTQEHFRCAVGVLESYGIEDGESETVAQALCYTLLDVETAELMSNL